jgi:hypothetical protein
VRTTQPYYKRCRECTHIPYKGLIPSLWEEQSTHCWDRALHTFEGYQEGVATEWEPWHHVTNGLGDMWTYHSKSGSQIFERNGPPILEIEHFAFFEGYQEGVATEWEPLHHVTNGLGDIGTYHSKSGSQICESNRPPILEIEHFALLRVIRRGWPLSENRCTMSQTVWGAWGHTIARVDPRFVRETDHPFLR